MNQIAQFKDFTVYSLTPELAEKYADEITTSLDQIPLTDPHTKENLLAPVRKDRVMYAKWEHSLIALSSDEKYAGVLVSYERAKEDNDQYPWNCIYLNDFAVSADFQKHGLGRFLMTTWVDESKKKGFLELEGPLVLAIQTNSADWNSHVQKLYESFGFEKSGEKQYDNRKDTIYKMEVTSLSLDHS